MPRALRAWSPRAHPSGTAPSTCVWRAQRSSSNAFPRGPSSHRETDTVHLPSAGGREPARQPVSQDSKTDLARRAGGVTFWYDMPQRSRSARQRVLTCTVFPVASLKLAARWSSVALGSSITEQSSHRSSLALMTLFTGGASRCPWNVATSPVRKNRLRMSAWQCLEMPSSAWVTSLWVKPRTRRL